MTTVMQIVFAGLFSMLLETILTQVSLDRNIDRGADIRALVSEIRRLIEFSLELVRLSDHHLGI